MPSTGFRDFLTILLAAESRGHIPFLFFEIIFKQPKSGCLNKNNYAVATNTLSHYFFRRLLKPNEREKKGAAC